MLKFRLGLLSILVLALAAGCGPRSRTPAKIAGKVTYKGQPVKAGNITFHTNDGDYPSTLNADGGYEITDVAAGPATVTIETESANPDKKTPTYGGQAGRSPAMDPSKMAGGAPAGVGGPSKEELAARYVKIPPKFKDATTSGLTVTLVAGRQTQNFDLND
jgi:hypothetical protein